MPTLSSTTTRALRDDLVSPELVLVDPDLAVRARHRLAEPADSSRRTEREARSTPSSPRDADVVADAVAISSTVAVSDAAAVSSTVAVSDAAAVSDTAAASSTVVPDIPDVAGVPELPDAFTSATPGAPDAAETFVAPDDAVRRLDAFAAEASEPPPQRLRRVLAAVAVTSAGLALAFLLAEGQLGPGQASLAVEDSASTELPQRSGEVDTAPSPPGTVPEEPPATVEPPSTAPPEPPASPASQRFAWAPVPGATEYHVELFRGSTRIFASNTPRPEITIPRRWTFEAKPYRLEPAEYRWYVWPVVGGKRTTEAVVQARLVVERD